MRPSGTTGAILAAAMTLAAQTALGAGDAAITVPLEAGAVNREVAVTFRNPTGVVVSDIGIEIVSTPAWASAVRLSTTSIPSLGADSSADVRVIFDVSGEATGEVPLRLRFRFTDTDTELDTTLLDIRPRFTEPDPEAETADEAATEEAGDAAGAVMRLVEVRGLPEQDGEAISRRFDPRRPGFLETRVRDFRGEITETVTSIGFTGLPMQFRLGDGFSFTAERRVQVNQDPAACDERGDSGIAGWGAGDVSLALEMAFGTTTRFKSRLERENPIPCRDNDSGGLGMHAGYRVGDTLTMSVRCQPRDDDGSSAADDPPRFGYRCSVDGNGDSESTMPGIRFSGARHSLGVELNGITLFYSSDGDGGDFEPYFHPFEVVQRIGDEAGTAGDPVLHLAAIEIEGAASTGGAGVVREEHRSTPRQRTLRESTGFVDYPALIRLGERFEYTVSLRAAAVVRDRYCVGSERVEVPADTYVGRGDMTLGQMNHARYGVADSIDFRCSDSARLLDSVHLGGEAQVRVGCEPVAEAETRSGGGQAWRYRCDYAGGPFAAGGRNRELELYWPGNGPDDPAAQVLLVNGFGIVSAPGQRRQVVLRYGAGAGADAVAYRHPFPVPSPWRHPEPETDSDSPVAATDTSGDGDTGMTDPAARPTDPDSPRIAALIDEWIAGAEPPQNAVNGDRFRYERWGRLVGTSVDGGVITINAEPDDAGAEGPHRYLWERRERLDSVDHCTLGEFVELRLADQSLDACHGRFGPQTPALAGMSRAEARSRIEALRLVPVLRDGDPAPSPELDGRVQRQSTDPGRRAARGDTLTAWVYTAPVDGIAVPDVTGLPLADATRILGAAGLGATMRIGGPAPQSRLTGRVEAQSPAAGTGIETGARVELSVYGAMAEQPAAEPSGDDDEPSTSPAPTSVTVGDYHALPVAEAESRVRALGLTPRLETGEPASTPDEAGTVFLQSPAAGDRIEPGAIVFLRYYDEALAKVTVPDVVGRFMPDALAELQALNLLPMPRRGDSAPDAARHGSVYAVEPAPGTALEEFSRVDIWFYDKPAGIALPDVTGLDAMEAGERLVAAGFSPRLESAGPAPNEDDAGRVASQSPAAGARLSPGAEIEIVAWGPPQRPPEPVAPAVPIPDATPAPRPPASSPAPGDGPASMAGAWEGSGQIAIDVDGQTMPLPFNLSWQVNGDGSATGSIEAGGQAMALTGRAGGGKLRLTGEQVSRDDDGTVTRIEAAIEGLARGNSIAGSSTYVIPDMACVMEALAEGIADAVAPLSSDEEPAATTCQMVEVSGEWQGRKLR